MKKLLLFLLLGAAGLWAQDQNLGNIKVNRITGGTDPVQDGSFLWNTAKSRFGFNLTLGTDEGNGSSDEFGMVIQTNEQLTPIAMPNFKGPLYLGSICNDQSSNAAQHSCNGLSMYNHIGTGNNLAYIEGMVVVVNNLTVGSGDGQMVGAEIDVSNDSGVDGIADAGCEAAPMTHKCKTNIYLGTGTRKNSWLIFEDVAGAGSAGGISMPNVSSGGPVLVGNNNNYIGFLNAARNNTLQALSINASNQTVVGSTGAPTLINGPAGLLFSPVAPTVASGFGTGASVVNANGTAAFQVNVGTGGTAVNGTVGLPNAPTGWNCTCSDTISANATVFLCKQVGGSLNTAIIGNYNTAGTLAAWVASDVLNVSCFAR